MSIGPKPKAEKPNVTTLQRTKIVGAKTTSATLQDPLRSIFLVGMAGTIVSLLLGRTLPRDLYILLGILWIYILARDKIRYYLAQE